MYHKWNQENKLWIVERLSSIHDKNEVWVPNSVALFEEQMLVSILRSGNPSLASWIK